MSLFDSIINEAAKKFGLGNKAGTLLSALLSLMTDQNRGGFAGFLDLFSKAGLGDLATSWIGSGANTELSGEQVGSVLGDAAISEIAQQSGLDASTAKSALAYMIPNVVDKLTPEGSVPDEKDLLTKIGDFLSGIGGTIAGAAVGAAGVVGAVASGAADTVGDAAEATVDAGKAVVGKGVDVVGKGADMVEDAASATLDAGKKAVGAVGDAAGSALSAVGDVFDGDDGDGSNNIWQWIIPLILLALALLLGFWFCSKSTPTPATNANTAKTNSNTGTTTPAKTIDSSVTVTAKDGKYTLTGVVPDQATKDKILAEAEAVWGKGNVNVDGIKVDASAKPFASGWFDGFKNMLGSLKDWKDGSISWVGNTIKDIVGIPADILSKIGGWFTGWGVPSLVTDAINAVRKLADVSLPDGTKLQAYPGGIEDQLIKFIQSDEYKNATPESLKDKWFTFDDLNFKFGTTELVPESKRQLDNITAILKAFPDVKIKIGGYTGKVGDPAKNKKLSDDRAKAVKAALDKVGVGAQVPEAEGYGSEFAVVPADASDKEREADRKTTVRLIK